MKKNFIIETFGCRTNQYEAELFREQLQQRGYAEGKEDVVLCWVHTCSVTAAAEKSCKAKIKSLCKEHPKARIIASGCFAKRSSEEMKAIDPRIEIVLEKKKEKIVPSLFPQENKEKEIQTIAHFQGHTRAFVKVQDGCSSFCSYCIIPQLRGASSSRPIPEIIREAEALAANGYQEIILTGVNIGEFQEGLSHLVEALDKIRGLERIRLSSIDPIHLDEKLIEMIVNGRTTMPHLHMVLQSASNKILATMKRKYTQELYLQKVEEIRKRREDFCFSTDVIVGFPTETEEDFLMTCDFIKKVGFCKVHVFPYSKRPKTFAAQMKDHIPSHVITERKLHLTKIAEETSVRVREKFVGREERVLLEQGDMGYTPQFLPVKIRNKGSSTGIALVELLENQKEHLTGKII